jgi:hypothetical protein
VFENRVLSRIFGPKRDEVMGEWRIRWAGYVACMGEGRNVYRVLVGKPKGKDHLKDQCVDGRMGLEWTLGR